MGLELKPMADILVLMLERWPEDLFTTMVILVRWPHRCSLSPFYVQPLNTWRFFDIRLLPKTPFKMQGVGLVHSSVWL